MNETTNFSRTYYREVKTNKSVSFSFEGKIEVYTGHKEFIYWKEDIENESESWLRFIFVDFMINLYKMTYGRHAPSKEI